jgi:hypothetical protein
LVTPTFLKKFENPHIRMVWHNAGIDLCEASKVVFIGYSLPKADYHLKTLFKRTIRADAEIAVVLGKEDKPPSGRKSSEYRDQAVDRYKDFFRSSEKEPTFYFNGVKGYFNRLMGPGTFKKRLQRLKRSFGRARPE